MQKKHAPLSSSIVYQYKNPNIPLAIKKARGAFLYDYNQNKLMDFYLNNGTCVLGYANKSLSQALKNEFSRGFLAPYPTHLQKRAENNIKALLQSFAPFCLKDYKVSFFKSELSLLKALKQVPQHSKVASYSYSSIIPETFKVSSELAMDSSTVYLGSSYTRLKDLPLEPFYMIINGVLANGYPIYTVLERQDSPLSLTDFTDSLLPFEAQSIIQTTKTLLSKPVESIFKELLTPYEALIEYQGQGCFKIKNIDKENDSISQNLLSHCIFKSPLEPLYYLSLQTTEDQIKYLFHSLKKIKDPHHS